MDFGDPKAPLSGKSTEPQLVLLGQGATGSESPSVAHMRGAPDKKLLLVGHAKGGVQVGGVTHIDTEDSLMLPMISSQHSQELPRGGVAEHTEGSEMSPLKHEYIPSQFQH